MSESSPLPVLIVGAGPVGLSLALALTQKQIPIAVFEADETLNTQIRASTFHPPTLEMFAEWGMVDEVMAQGFTVHELQYWERSTRERIASFDYQHIAQDTPFPYRLQCPQHLLTRILKPLVEASPYGRVYMGHRFIAFEETAAEVTAHFETAAGRASATGRLLCGADGASSAVRKELGFTFSGMTYEDRFLLIGTTLDLDPLFPGLGPVSYMFDPEEWTIVLQIPDLTRIVFRMQEHEDEAEATREEALQARLDRFLETGQTYNIEALQLYKTHQRVADRFYNGRVVLLGDAAHINNPAGGMGMNSGIHDAYHLADKIGRIYHSQADVNEQFGQYEAERRRNALQNVRQQTDKNYRDLTAQDDVYRQERNQQLRAQAADPAQARAYLLKASMLADRI